MRPWQTVATLDHPCIIHLDDFWVEPSRAYLVMPFISGGTLQDILRKQQGFLELERIVSYLEYICAALDYAHGQGVAHLDLKPLNLLVHEDGRLLLSDFGLAHLMKQETIEGGSSLRFGTPHYMAPEHVQGRPERRSDLFSLGVMLYQMLVGRRPFEGLTPEAVMIKNITAWPLPPRTFRPELPQTVEDVLGRALAKQPEQRYRTANELLLAFKKALATPAKPRIASSHLDQVTPHPEARTPAPAQPRSPSLSPHLPTASDKPSVFDSFIKEMSSYLLEIEANLERLAQSANDMEALEETYRRAHGIGSSASMMDFPGLAHVAHGMEDTLGDIIDNMATLDPPTLGPLQRSLQRMHRLVDGIHNGIDEDAIIAEDEADYIQYRALIESEEF